MNYYNRHIGDYMKDASHLNLLEHGVYVRLMDVYYSREAPIPHEQRFRLVGARTPEEQAAVDMVLEEFFVLEAGHWQQSRCDRELAHVAEKSQKAQSAAAARWEKTKGQPAKAQPPQSEGNPSALPSESESNPNAEQTQTASNPPAMPEECERNADAMQTHSECNADGMPSQYPTANNQETPPEGPPLATVHWFDELHLGSDLAPEIVLSIRSAKGYESFAPERSEVQAMLDATSEFVPDDDAIRETVSAFVDRANKRRGQRPEYSDPILTIRNWLRRDEARFRQIKRQREIDARHAAKKAEKSTVDSVYAAVGINE